MSHQASTPSSDDEVILELRRSAQSLWRERERCSAESQRLWQANDKHGAKDFSERSHAFEQRAMEEDRVAAGKIFAYKNAHVRPDEIDLHGLRVEESLRFLQQRLEAPSQEAYLVVIYGKGHHSKDHKQHIKPAVLALLKERNMAFREGIDGGTNRVNEGVCTVTLQPAVAKKDFDSGLRIKVPGRTRTAEPHPKGDESSCCTVM